MDLGNRNYKWFIAILLILLTVSCELAPTAEWIFWTS